MTSQVNIRMIYVANLQRCQYKGFFPRKTKLSERNRPRMRTFYTFLIFHTDHLGSDQSRDLPLSLWGNAELAYHETWMI